MSPARIVIVTNTFPRLSETFIVSKYLGLRQSGWKVSVACSRFAKHDLVYFPALAQEKAALKEISPQWPHRSFWLVLLLLPVALVLGFVRVPGVTLRYLTRGWKRFGFRVIKQYYLDLHIILLRPDLVHFEFGAPAVERMYLKDLLGAKLTVSFRGYDLNYVGLEDPNYYLPVWAAADGLHFLGEDLRRRALYRGCPEEMPYALIPPAIDPDIFKPSSPEKPSPEQASPQRSFRILSVGRLEWKKGYEYGLEAVRLAKEQGLDFEYRVIGDGSYDEALAFAVHQMGLEGVVHLMGSQPVPEVRRWMEWADIFLHSAVSEGFCNAVIEAQAMELPVIASDADGLRENVADGETGFIVPRRDPASMAERLLLLAQDPALRIRTGKAGRVRVRRLFSLEQQRAAFNEFYGRMLA